MSDFRHDDDDRKLFAAAKAEAPKPGAKGRALGKALAELSVVIATEAPPPRRALRIGIPVAVSAGALLMMMGLHLQRAEEQDEARARAVQLEANQEARLNQLMAEVHRQTKVAADLQAAVKNAKDDLERQAALAQLANARRAQADASAQSGGAAPHPTKSACNCTPGDPLCSCVP